MTKTILYFTAGEKPTNDELTEISKLNAQTTAAFEVVVMCGDLAESTLEYGAGLKHADYVAGTIPDAYSDEEDYPVADPDSLPLKTADGATVVVKNSAGSVSKDATAEADADGYLTDVKLAATVALVTNGDTKTGVTGSGTTATITVANGVISGIALS